MFIAALLTITKRWRQPKSPRKKKTEDVVGIHTHTHNGILLIQRYHEKDKILPLAKTRMDLENIMKTEINQREKDKKHVTSFTCEL